MLHQARNQVGEATLEKFSPPMEKCVGHSFKLLDTVQKNSSHMVGRVRARAPWKFIDAPLWWRAPRIRTTGA